jgi:rubrerythrin
MKILCSTSGIQFNCDHVPASLHAREAEHPIFTLKQPKLYNLYAKYLQGELTEIDSYLLYLALFKSTEHVEFRRPAERTTSTASIIARNIKQLVGCVTTMNAHPNMVCASFVITPDTKTLENSHIWIETWESNYADYNDNYKKQIIRTNLKRREEHLETLIKNANRSPERYARILSNWAAEAGEFPTFQVTNTFTGGQCTLSEYWQQIIQFCVMDSKIFQIPKADIDELIEHVETYIPVGSIYQYSLIELLKTGKSKNSAFLGFGDIDITTSTYRIMDDATPDVERANILAMIDSAPTKLPTPDQYPSKIAYLRAKFKYEAACRYNAEMENLAAVEHTTELNETMDSISSEEESSNNDSDGENI